jgi:hypothetical protein
MSVERTWECKCGEIKVKLTGEPMSNVNCYCKSCQTGAVSAKPFFVTDCWKQIFNYLLLRFSCLIQKFIQEKTNGTGIYPLNKNGGVAITLFPASRIEFLAPLSAEDGTSKLNFIRVGDRGKAFRSYTTCCGSQMTCGCFPTLIGFNRAGIKNADGAPYEPTDSVNVMASHSYDASLVPEPKSNHVPFDLTTLNTVVTLLNPFGSKFKEKELYPDNADTEVLNVTW